MADTTPLKMNLKLSRVRTAHDKLTDALDGFVARLGKLDEDGAEAHSFPQAAAEAALLLKAMEEAITAARKAFNEAAIGHRRSGGEFEPGRVAISFQDQERRTPSWQDVAVEWAKKDAFARSEPFSKTDYIESVKAQTKPVALTIVKLTENAG
jgi:hypothetical protein